MKTVFAFRGVVAKRNALHDSLGEDLAAIATTWLKARSSTSTEISGAQTDRQFAWLAFVSSRNPEIDGFENCTVAISQVEDEARFDLHLSTSDGKSPFRASSHKPEILHALTSVGRVTVSGLQVDRRPVVIKIEQAKQFTDRLTSSKREYPVVVVSATADGRNAVRPTELAEALEGMAQVIQVQSSPVTEQIEKVLGPRLAVKEGEVRIYWPGLNRESSTTLHRIFRPHADGSGVTIEAIYEAINRVLASKFKPDGRVREFIAAHPGTWPVDIAEADDFSIVVGPSAISIDSPDVDPIRDLKSENANLRDELAAQAKRIATLERELFDSNERIQLSTLADRFSMDSIHQFALIPNVLSVQTIADLVLLFESHVPDSAIIFLPEAHESARKSPFSGGLLGPAKMLEAVCAVATRYHLGNLHAGEDFKRAFQAAGEASFAPDSSPTTLGKYRAKYARLYDDGTGMESVLLRPHLSFGSGRAHSSVKIYWHVDERNRRFVIGQIGAHLPIASRL